METNRLAMEAGASFDRPGAAYHELLAENARLRGDLLTVARRINHDLQTPLGGIMSAGEALKEILGETDPSVQPMVTSALNLAEDVSRLIKRTSFVLKASACPLPPQATDMSGVVSTVLSRLESRILSRDATVSQPEAWPEVQGVAAWLEVIWWNLLANALQHAGASPQIELGWGREKAGFSFWVADNGPGVAASRLSQLFQPFHQLHASDAAGGLGLSFVQRMVELQGGECGYEANVGGGACFFFTLPDQTLPPDPAAPQSSK